MKILVHIEKGENGYFVVSVPSLPGCHSQGRTVAEAKRNIKEAIELHLKCLLEDGIPVAPPKGVRQETVTVEI